MSLSLCLHVPRERGAAFCYKFSAMRVILLLAFCFGCATTPRVPQADVIADVLDDFHDAASKADGARYFAHFAPEGMFLGTDASERWTVDEFRRYAEPHFSKGEGWTYTAKTRYVEISGAFAWFDEILVNKSYGELRGSGALKRIDGEWKILQYNLTFLVPNDKAKSVVEAIRPK